MCYKAEDFTNNSGEKVIKKFIFEEIKNTDTQEWVLSGIEQLELWKGRISNKNLETKHIRGKIFELKFKKLPVRILYSYHPNKRKTILLLHGVIKKRDDLTNRDIETAEKRYNDTKI